MINLVKILINLGQMEQILLRIRGKDVFALRKPGICGKVFCFPYDELFSLYVRNGHCHPATTI